MTLSAGCSAPGDTAHWPGFIDLHKKCFVIWIKAGDPDLIVPCHCTGFRAESLFAVQMPGVFREGVVGATYLF